MTNEEFAKTAYLLGKHLGETNASAPIIEGADDIIRHAERLQRNNAQLVAALENMTNLFENCTGPENGHWWHKKDIAEAHAAIAELSEVTP